MYISSTSFREYRCVVIIITTEITRDEVAYEHAGDTLYTVARPRRQSSVECA
jgi:hypothetical protein